MFDLDLLRAFVSVVDAGGFTQAGARVHRTQSTVSQQIRRLEDQAGKRLFLRDGRKVRLTEDGERLLGFARRLLALSAEAAAALSSEPAPAVVRLGIPDDFAVDALTGVVAAFAVARPEVRLAVRCGLSCDLMAELERGELDVALFKREPGLGPAVAAWPEDLVWVAGADYVPTGDPVPLVAFPQGCLYRNRAVHALEAAGRRWRIAYESPSLLGVQAAVSGGLGVALLERRAVKAGQAVMRDPALYPPVPPTELALCTGAAAGAPARDLAATISAFCSRAVGTPLAA